jgi:hypothetical protein
MDVIVGLPLVQKLFKTWGWGGDDTKNGGGV